MRAQGNLRTEFEEFLEAHRGLRIHFAVVERDLERGRSVDSLLGRFDRLDRELESHFWHEEQGGYLGNIASRNPRLSRVARRLEREHCELLGDLRRLRTAVARVTADGDWCRLRSGFGRLRRRFERHESREDHLLLEATQRDSAAQD